MSRRHGSLPLPEAVKSCAARDVPTPDGYATDANCIRDLALGWCTSADLCGSCTRVMMKALDAAYGQPLPWHVNYINRGRPEGGYPP